MWKKKKKREKCKMRSGFQKKRSEIGMSFRRRPSG